MARPARIVTALRQRRRALGISELELAKRIGVSQRAIRSWEYGERSPDAYMIDRYADALGATLSLDPCLPDSHDLDNDITVERAVRGEMPWRALTQPQRLEVFSRLRAKRWGFGRIAQHLHVSWSTIAAVESGSVPRQNGAAA